MTKAELIKNLSHWPDDAEIILYIVESYGEIRRYPLEYIEYRDDLIDPNSCNLYGGPGV